MQCWILDEHGMAAQRIVQMFFNFQCSRVSIICEANMWSRNVCINETMHMKEKMLEGGLSRVEGARGRWGRMQSQIN